MRYALFVVSFALQCAKGRDKNLKVYNKDLTVDSLIYLLYAILVIT